MQNEKKVYEMTSSEVSMNFKKQVTLLEQNEELEINSLAIQDKFEIKSTEYEKELEKIRVFKE